MIRFIRLNYLMDSLLSSNTSSFYLNLNCYYSNPYVFSSLILVIRLLSFYVLASISSLVELYLYSTSNCIAYFLANSSAILRASWDLVSNSILAFIRSFSFCLLCSFILSPCSNYYYISTNLDYNASYSFFICVSILIFSFNCLYSRFFSSSATLVIF